MSNPLPPIPKPRVLRSEASVKKPVPLPRTQKLTSEQNLNEQTFTEQSCKPDIFTLIKDEIAGKVQEKKKSAIQTSKQISEDLQCKKKSAFETSKQITADLSDKVHEGTRAVIETSRHITGEITGKVQEKKRVMIETTRNASQSVRNIVAKRFGSLTRDGNVTCSAKEVNETKTQSLPLNSEIFEGIQFESPLSLEMKQKHQDLSKIYNNLEEDDEDNLPNFPPPTIPPPPLPDESVYDAPSSIHSGSSGSKCGTISSISLSERLCYEEIFPDSVSVLNFARNNGSDTENDTTYMNEPIRDGSEVHRSDSWSFYDSINSCTTDSIYNNVAEVENIYANDLPSPPVNKDLLVNNHDPQRISELSAISVQNSLYENHILEPEKVEKINNESSTGNIRESMIREFDPLANIESNSKSLNDLSILESLLEGDTYGTVGKDRFNEYNDWSQSEDDSETESNLPTPPQRFDSLPAVLDDSKKIENQSSNWFVSLKDHQEITDETPKPIPTTVNDINEIKNSDKSGWMPQRWSNVFKLVPPSAKNITRMSFRGRDDLKMKSIERPSLINQSLTSHKGNVVKVGRNLTMEDFFGDLNPRYCHLINGKLIAYTDNTMRVAKETITLDSILSIQLIAQSKIMPNSDKNSFTAETELYCFEIATTSKGPRSRHVFGTDNMSDRRIWMQKILESLTDVFSTTLTSDYTRVGWVYLREGASGEWKGAWLLLHYRKMVYCQNNGQQKEIDLRKARCIVFQEPEIDAPKTDDSGPQLLVDCVGEGAIYIRSILGRTTRIWRHAVRCSAHNNGPAIDQQQLTHEDVPVIVDKCINFVYAHGSMSEGIYRRSGSDKIVAELLTLFRHDAWSVQLTKEKYSENDVACVLKRFFRNLPDSVFTSKLHLYFCRISEMSNQNEKVDLYKQLLEQLPPVCYQTIRKLMAHLNFIQSQVIRNQMSIKNLSTVWGPSLMVSDSANGSTQFSKSVVSVIADMISLKAKLWPADNAELLRERTMLSVLERYYHSSQPSTSKHSPSGDLRVWIHLNEPNSGKCYHIAISPQKTANDICHEVSSKMNIPAHLLQLEESVLGGHLIRPIHFSEKVLDVVLRWGYWDEVDRKDNCLVVRKATIFTELSNDGQRSLSMSGELKYADEKSKSFKNYTFEFSQAKLTYYKDKNCSIKLGQWPIEDIIWYIGHEPKRDPHVRWCMTFISRLAHPKRTKTAPWFGHAIAGSDRSQQLRWIAAMAFGEYPQGLFPPAIHVNLIENF